VRIVPIERWTVRAIAPSFDAPSGIAARCFELEGSGTAHEALLRAGWNVHPDAAGGEAAQEWIGSSDWRFSAWCRLDERALEADRIDLVVDRLDALGEVRLNGVRSLLGADAFVPLRTQVRSVVRAGHNEIDVSIRGPVAAVRALERTLGTRPVNGDWTPFSFLRTSACSFGWDWGPRAPTVGVHGARFECWSGARLDAVCAVVVRCDEQEAVVRIDLRCERIDDRPLEAACELLGPDGDVVARGESHVDDAGRCRIELVVRAPRRWWPRGFGPQTLHRLHTVLRDGGVERGRDERRIGLRSVRLDRTPDEHGTAFRIVVNEKPIWCTGANWIPVEVFPRSAPRSRTEALVDLAAEADCAMLRVWGGGIDESDAFFERCDELGILIWQDFYFACATYPEDDPYPALVEAEARRLVELRASHPSIVLWCGGNENTLAWWSWGWRERLRPGQSWGYRYWSELLPSIVGELDPSRPYWVDSPWSGSLDVHPNDPDHGDRHTWDAKLEAMRTIVPRFTSEFGHQSPPTLASLRDVFPEEALFVGCEPLADRQRAWGGDAFQYGPHIAERFPEPRSLDEWIFAAQLVQARSYGLSIEWMRANAPRCMGALFWQWNDVWRGHSWSVVDAALRVKPAFFAVKRAQAQLMLACIPTTTGLDAVVCSSSADLGSGSGFTIDARLVDLDGTVLEASKVLAQPSSPWTARIALSERLARPARPASSVLLLRVDGRSDVFDAAHWFVHDRAISSQRPTFDVEAVDERRFRIACDRVARDVCFLCADPNPLLRADVGMFTLAPDSPRVVTFLGGAPRSVDDVRSWVRCAQDVGGAQR
jgi:beta-mannosidase